MHNMQIIKKYVNKYAVYAQYVIDPISKYVNKYVK
jgi:hypothetical protein